MEQLIRMKLGNELKTLKSKHSETLHCLELKARSSNVGVETMQRRSLRRPSMSSISLDTFDSGFDSGEFFFITERMRQEMVIDCELDYVSKFNSHDYAKAVLDMDEAFVFSLIRKELAQSYPRRNSLPRVIRVVEENQIKQEKSKETEKIHFSSKETLHPRMACKSETCRKGRRTNSKSGGKAEKHFCSASDDILGRKSSTSSNQLMLNKPLEAFEKSTHAKRHSPTRGSETSTRKNSEIPRKEENKDVFDHTPEQHLHKKHRGKRTKGSPVDITFKNLL